MYYPSLYIALEASHYTLRWPGPRAAAAPLALVRKPEAAGCSPMLIPLAGDAAHSQGFFIRISVRAAPPSPWSWLITAQLTFLSLSSKRLKMLTKEGPRPELCSTGRGDAHQTAIPLARVLAWLPPEAELEIGVWVRVVYVGSTAGEHRAGWGNEMGKGSASRESS